MTGIKLPQSMQRLTHEVMNAASNGIAYDVWTWTPPVYDTSEDAFPLVVVLDGDMFMGAAIDTVALVSTIGEARPAIIVGVTTAPPGNHGIQRTIDYSAEAPTEEMLKAPPGTEFSFWALYQSMFAEAGLRFEDGFGGTDAFLSFLTDELLVKLHTNYRIDADEIGIAGHSSGGDFAVDTLLRKQTPFSKFIVGSFGTDVLERTLPGREQAFADTAAPRHLNVFAGYGGAELTDPYLTQYIERGVDLLNRLQASDTEQLSITIRNFERETHGSVFPHVFSTGFRELWGTGLSFVEAVAALSAESDSGGG